LLLAGRRRPFNNSLVLSCTPMNELIVMRRRDDLTLLLLLQMLMMFVGGNVAVNLFATGKTVQSMLLT